MALAEKFWKEIRAVPWVQIMIDGGGASHRVSRNRLSQIIQNWPLCDKCTIYEEKKKKVPVSLRCCWADSDFFVFCSNSLEPPDPDLWRFFAFSGHAKLLSRELPGDTIRWFPFSHLNQSARVVVAHDSHHIMYLHSAGCSKWFQQMSAAVADRNRWLLSSCQMRGHFTYDQLHWLSHYDNLQ